MHKIAIAAITAALLTGTSAAWAAPTFSTIDNPGDPTFNQLLGINNAGTIAGYFGSGAAGHPNRAYTIAPPYTSFKDANVPGSVQTQATGINDANDVTQFWTATNTGTDDDFGAIRIPDGAFFEYLSVNDPLVAGTTLVNQVLGINKAKISVGFYNDANGMPHGFSYNAVSGSLMPVNVGGSLGAAATAINDNNLVAGFFIDGFNHFNGFVKNLVGNTTTKFHVTGAVTTQLLGINDAGLAVGFYSGNDMITHGVLFNIKDGKSMTLDNPAGPLGTVLNGLNNKGQVVGFYTDYGGNVHGMLINGVTAP